MNRITRTLTGLAVLLLAVTSGRTQDIFEPEKGLYSTEALTLTAPVDRQTRLVIKSAGSLTGRISVTVADQNEVSLTYYKQSRASSRSRAIDYIDLLAAGLKALPDNIRLELRAPNPAPWESKVEAGMIDVELVVPLGFVIEMEATYYDLTARGPLKGVEVSSSLGRFDISDVDGVLKVATKNRRIQLDNIKGTITVSTTNSTLTAANIESNDDAALFRNEGGDIQIDGFRGRINVKNSYGRTVIREFAPRGNGNFIRGVSGPISLKLSEMPEGQLVVKNRYEDIELTVPDTLSADFSLSVDDEGEIEAVGFPFASDLVERNRLSLTSGDGAVEIVCSISGKGNVYVRGVKGE